MIKMTMFSIMLFFIGYMMLMLKMYFLWYNYELTLGWNMFSLNILK